MMMRGLLLKDAATSINESEAPGNGAQNTTLQQV
jgi:hypothetical protein